MKTPDKPLEWIGSSHKDLMALPVDIRRFFGFALSLAQAGDQHDAASTYRAVYTVKYEETVFVLHCFQKKSKRGSETPKEDMDIVRARLKVAEKLAKEWRNEKKTR